MMNEANLKKLIGEMNHCLKNIGYVITNTKQEWRNGKNLVDITLDKLIKDEGVNREITCVSCTLDNEEEGLLNDIILNLLYKKLYAPSLFEKGGWEKLNACFVKAQTRVKLGIKIDSEDAGDNLLVDVAIFCDKLL